MKNAYVFVSDKEYLKTKLFNWNKNDKNNKETLPPRLDVYPGNV